MSLFFNHVQNKICKTLVALLYIARISFNKNEAAVFNPLTANVPHHTETSQLIWNANQLPGFYMMGNIVR